jgi:hypothetical protein
MIITGHEVFHAIITQAVEDAGYVAPASYSPKTKSIPILLEAKQDALQWLLEDTSSFYYICEGAGIENVEEFRKKLREKLHGNTL